MRIIAGTARGLSLKVPHGTRVRPTSGRVRTSLFSILADCLEGARVADLFAGCGALGIEALSRGAASCAFVENARQALAALRDNLARARLADRATVLVHDAFDAASLIGAAGPLDLVLVDPPYRVLHEQPQRFLTLMKGLAPGLAPDGFVVVQHDGQTVFPSAIGCLRLTDRRSYGATGITFFTLAESRS